MPDTFRELFLDEVKDIYDAEHRITKALPKMAQAANSEELVAAFEDHLSETEEHIRRLEEVFEAIDESPARKTCKAMVGLLEEGQEIIDDDDGSPEVKDAALIAAAQKVEHYEMATYGCLRTWAELLDEDDSVRLLQTTLDEEGAADKKLTEIAQSLNVEAAEETGEDEGEEEEEKEPATVSQGRRPSAASGRSSPKSRSR
jgi:ferritin-like metal-binding protein YciE